jgi:hypothetical protein
MDQGTLPPPGHHIPRRRLGRELLGRIALHEVQHLVYLVISRGDAHEGTPARDTLSIPLGFVR